VWSDSKTVSGGEFGWGSTSVKDNKGVLRLTQWLTTGYKSWCLLTRAQKADWTNAKDKCFALKT